MGSGASRRLFWGVGIGVVVLDFLTKQLAVAHLSRMGLPLLGEWLSFRLVYNKGAAFGISVGDHSRWVFMGLALLALVVLGAMVRQTRSEQWVRLLALALVCGGAVGNLIDRFRSASGVVDFIDVYIGAFHWPTFNVADMAVSCGAISLAVVLWREGKQDVEAASGSTGAEAGSS